MRSHLLHVHYKETTALVDLGWRVITANRNPLRAEAAAVRIGLPSGSPRQLEHLYMDLGDLESVRDGVKALFECLDTPLDALVCNAAVYLPRLSKPQRSAQGDEISMATNHFGHFLLIQLLLIICSMTLVMIIPLLFATTLKK